MPAEWEPHRGTWLSWPHKEASWPGKFGPVPGIFARLARHLADHEEVHINVSGPALRSEAMRALAAEGADRRRIFFHQNPTNDAWCRDHGPIFVQRDTDGRHESAILDWGYNAWGGKYPPYDLDDVVPSRIAAELGLPLFEPGIVLEGGSIDVKGEGPCSRPRRVSSIPTATRSSVGVRSRSTFATTSASARFSGWVTASSATTPMAMWMTSLVS